MVMVRQQWRIRVWGKQCQQVSVDLLVAAVLAFGEQLAAEEREESATEGRMRPLCRLGREEGQ